MRRGNLGNKKTVLLFLSARALRHYLTTDSCYNAKLYIRLGSVAQLVRAHA